MDIFPKESLFQDTDRDFGPFSLSLYLAIYGKIIETDIVLNEIYKESVECHSISRSFDMNKIVISLNDNNILSFGANPYSRIGTQELIREKIRLLYYLVTIFISHGKNIFLDLYRDDIKKLILEGLHNTHVLKKMDSILIKMEINKNHPLRLLITNIENHIFVPMRENKLLRAEKNDKRKCKVLYCYEILDDDSILNVN